MLQDVLLDLYLSMVIASLVPRPHTKNDGAWERTRLGNSCIWMQYKKRVPVKAGTRNGSKMRAARYHMYHHHTRRASLFTGLVDWTGLTQKSVRCLFQCRTEAKHTYLFACIACFRVSPRLGRGQRSRAYLTL